MYAYVHSESYIQYSSIMCFYACDGKEVDECNKHTIAGLVSHKHVLHCVVQNFDT